MTHKSKYTFFDTDMKYHLDSPDENVANKAEFYYKKHAPTAMSSFSLLEYKGRFLSDLGLLRRKINDSHSLKEVFIRIDNSNIRPAKVMFMQLLNLLEQRDWKIEPWENTRQELLVHIDAKMAVAWLDINNSVDMLFDELECTRAQEEPCIESGRWNTRIPRCTGDNRHCRIASFLIDYVEQLTNLLDSLIKTDHGDLTNELRRFIKYIEKAVGRESPWEIMQCRQIGDLLIGLQCIDSKGLVSSNYKEHEHLSKGLGYSFHKFPLADSRIK